MVELRCLLAQSQTPPALLRGRRRELNANPGQDDPGPPPQRGINPYTHVVGQNQSSARVDNYIATEH